ncbi:MAG: histidine kinase [Sutterellaceae bacterium]|nr:histidine kinase [Sutterellaceae bacterium]MDY2867293.1 histidine kinase [Mesosutterella sp.]
MKFPTFQSLSMRLLALTALWVSFVVGVVAYTMVLSWNAESSAAALNQVNEIKLRFHRANIMAGPKYSEAQMIAEMQASDRLIEGLRSIDVWNPFMAPNTPEIQKGIGMVEKTWKSEAAPQLLIQKQTGAKIDSEIFNSYLGALDSLKNQIETFRGKYLWQMRYLQILIIVLAVGSLFVILFLLDRWVIRPVNKLGAVFEQFRGGDFSARVDLGKKDEFGRIGEGFNRMASALEDLYSNLEAKVAEKTASVQEKNTNLSQLYEMTTFLSQNATVEEMTEGFIDRIRNYTQGDGCVVRLVDSTGRLGVTASTGVSGRFLELAEMDSSQGSILQEAFAKPLPTRFDLGQSANEAARELVAEGFRVVYLFHIRNGQANLGSFEVLFKSDRDLQSAAFRQLESFGTHLGVAIENHRLNERERQFAVVQERTFMAQGLHDSIAQTLSFLNMQVQLLESGLESKDEEMVQETVKQIKAGVQESYENVRELLLNFREKIHKEDFQTALLTVTKRFEAQAGVPAKVEFEGRGAPLTDKQKLQVTFIVQEALSNIRKHARATHVVVHVENGRDFKASVADDGIGIDPKIAAARKGQHVGLSIMEERAKKIGAVLSVESELGHGTRVTVRIPEANRKAD